MIPHWAQILLYLCDLLTLTRHYPLSATLNLRFKNERILQKLWT